MKLLTAIFLLATLVALASAQNTNEQTESVIIANKGWGKIQLGADRKTVEEVTGKGQGQEGFKFLKDVYFREYPAMGVQVSYNHQDDKVQAIFFYNKQHRYENFAPAPVKTDKRVTWKTSYNELKKIYGKPLEDHSGNGWRRVVYEGIDFRFENNEMVRIGIPGK